MKTKIRLITARYLIAIPETNQDVVVELCNCEQCNGYLKGPSISSISKDKIGEVFSEFAKQAFDATISEVDIGCENGSGIKRWGAQIQTK